MTDLLAALRSVMYELFHLDDVDAFAGLDDDAFRRLTALYPRERIERFRQALAWAMVCPDFDFLSLLPNLPYTNQQIAAYLTRYHETLERHAASEGWPPVSLA